MIDAAEHVGLVWFVVQKTAPHKCEDEAFLAGSEALVRAARDFDPDRGIKFSTLACKYIYTAIDRERKMRRQKMRDERRTVSFTPLMSNRIIGATAEPSRFEQLDDEQDTRLRLHEILCKIEPVHADVLMRRARGESFQHIADHYGCSRNAVQQAERRALRACRDAAGIEVDTPSMYHLTQAADARRRRMKMPDKKMMMRSQTRRDRAKY